MAESFPCSRAKHQPITKGASSHAGPLALRGGERLGIPTIISIIIIVVIVIVIIIIIVVVIVIIVVVVTIIVVVIVTLILVVVVVAAHERDHLPSCRHQRAALGVAHRDRSAQPPRRRRRASSVVAASLLTPGGGRASLGLGRGLGRGKPPLTLPLTLLFVVGRREQRRGVGRGVAGEALKAR